MNVALWIVAGVLAAAFLAAGIMKTTQTKEQLAEKGQDWVEDFSPSTIRLIGVAEVLGALGLILPGVLDIAPVLVPLAATGLAITMVLAAGVHVRRRELPMVAVNAVLFAGAAFVAWGRFGSYAL